jgi:hypothetical protein
MRRTTALRPAEITATVKAAPTSSTTALKSATATASASMETTATTAMNAGPRATTKTKGKRRG